MIFTIACMMLKSNHTDVCYTHVRYRQPADRGVNDNAFRSRSCLLSGGHANKGCYRSITLPSPAS